MEEPLDNLIILVWIREKVESINILPLLQKLFKAWILSYCLMKILGPSHNNDRHILKDKIFRKQIKLNLKP